MHGLSLDMALFFNNSLLQFLFFGYDFEKNLQHIPICFVFSSSSRTKNINFVTVIIKRTAPFSQFSDLPTLNAKWWMQALSRSYGCFFAEFLEKHSLVRLSLLDSTTCVGFRYGFFSVMLRSFSRKAALSHPIRRT